MSFFYAIISVLVVSLVSLVGIFTLSLKEGVLRQYIFLLVSLAVGALIGDAFIHLIPEAFEEIQNQFLVSGSLIGGILIFFVLEKVLHWHHHDMHTELEHHIHPTGRMILFSDGVHNFLDGLIIGASYMVSVPVGIATTIAILLHEIPQEVGDFAILVHAGYSRRRALFLNFLSALTALLGVLLVYVIGMKISILITWLVPFAAGGFIYIAMTDLIPEMHKTKNILHSFWQLCFVLLGIGAMTLLLFIE